MIVECDTCYAHIKFEEIIDCSDYKEFGGCPICGVEETEFYEV